MKRSRVHEEVSDFEQENLHAKTPVVGSPRASKITEVDSAVIDDDGQSVITMRCTLPPHKTPLTFTSYDAYESHYHSFHTNRCLDCRKNFPSEHLLGVHIEEWHDPLVVIKRDRGEHTYSCFEKDCERKCLTHQKRRMHLVDKHSYPKNYFFGVTKEGIDGRTSLLNDQAHHRRRSSTTFQGKRSRRRSSLLSAQFRSEDRAKPESQKLSGQSSDETSEAADTAMSDLTGAMSALKFVPHSVRFGKGRAGFSKP